MLTRVLILFFLSCTIVACGTVETKPTALEIVKPRSILVIPVVNNSVEVDAATYVLSTLTTAIADRGYYVFPVNTVKVVMEHEGWYEPAEAHQLPPDMVAGLFGADAILYVTIHKWTNEYLLISSRTIVDLEYKIVSATGETLWSARKQKTYNPNQNSSSSGNLLADLVASAVVSAIERASPQYMQLTKMANNEVFISGRSRLPPGPYYNIWDPRLGTKTEVKKEDAVK